VVLNRRRLGHCDLLFVGGSASFGSAGHYRFRHFLVAVRLGRFRIVSAGVVMTIAVVVMRVVVIKPV